MSMIPEMMPGDIERESWHRFHPDNPDLEGKPISLEDLKGTLLEVIGEDTELVTVSKNDNWTVYGYRYHGKGMKIKFAYLCHHCESLVLGQPKIHDDISIRDAPPMSGGREGYDISCRECDYSLEGFTGMIS